jgi:hypothetical protein
MNNTNNINSQLSAKANESTATLIEEERLIAKLSIKTLSDRTIKLDFVDDSLTLAQLKEKLVEHVELPVDQQFFLLAGKVYGKKAVADGVAASADDSIKIVDLPGFKTPENVIKEFEAYEEKRKNEDDSDSNSHSNVTIIKGIEELLPTLYIFHYEPAAKALDPLEAATDWDQKNRLKFFKGIWSLAERNLSEAAKFLVEALPTFEENGCMPYKELVKYAVIAASVTFDRPSLKSKVNQIASQYNPY